jgi:hypothetical protein
VDIQIVGTIDNPEDDNVDVILRLDDGRVYTFVVATPKNIYRCMQNEGIDYFFGVPPFLLKVITPDAIRQAIDAVLSENGGRWLSV